MLDFYYSTMQGGKSTALLQRRYNLTSIGQRVLVMTSALDDRYGVGKVTSRMGPQCEAVLFNKATVFDPALGLDQIDELLIDESQFLTRAQVKQIHQRLCVGMALRGWPEARTDSTSCRSTPPRAPTVGSDAGHGW